MLFGFAQAVDRAWLRRMISEALAGRAKPEPRLPSHAQAGRCRASPGFRRAGAGVEVP